MEQMAKRFAEEHKRFLEEHNPAVLRGQYDQTSYLSSVGHQAAERYALLMMSHNNSKEVQALPHQQRVQELQSRRHEVEEMIRDELLHQPRPA